MEIELKMCHVFFKQTYFENMDTKKKVSLYRRRNPYRLFAHQTFIELLEQRIEPKETATGCSYSLYF